MQVYLNNVNELDKIDGLQTAVALGRFDAMHLGHIKIIKKSINYAKENGIKSLVYMFSNNPIEVIEGKNIPSVNNLEKRIDILNSLDVDIVVAQDFDAEIMNMNCENFADMFLKNIFRAKFVVAGYNYNFGKGGQGDISVLRKLCNDRNIELYAMPEITVDESPVSSTIIRKLIAEGNVRYASKLMGRHYSISGTVVKGNGIGGSELGFPTANINFPEDCVLPKLGVYISRTRVDGIWYSSITNVGGKPTIDNSKGIIETYINGTFGELYGKTIEVELYDRLRDIVRFRNKAALVQQLNTDKQKMKEYFKEV